MNNNQLVTKPHYQLLNGLWGVAAIIAFFGAGLSGCFGYAKNRRGGTSLYD